MFPTPQRRASLQNLRSHKTSLAFTTEKRLPPIAENRELKKNVTVIISFEVEITHPSSYQVYQQ